MAAWTTPRICSALYKQDSTGSWQMVRMQLLCAKRKAAGIRAGLRRTCIHTTRRSLAAHGENMPLSQRETVTHNHTLRAWAVAEGRLAVREREARSSLTMRAVRWRCGHAAPCGQYPAT